MSINCYKPKNNVAGRQKRLCEHAINITVITELFLGYQTGTSFLISFYTKSGSSPISDADPDNRYGAASEKLVNRQYHVYIEVVEQDTHNFEHEINFRHSDYNITMT